MKKNKCLKEKAIEYCKQKGLYNMSDKEIENKCQECFDDLNDISKKYQNFKDDV